MSTNCPSEWTRRLIRRTLSRREDEAAASGSGENVQQALLGAMDDPQIVRSDLREGTLRGENSLKS